MKRIILIISATAALLSLTRCAGYLDQLPSGNYTNENLEDFPSLIRGFVDKAYDMIPSAYTNTEYLTLESASDDVVNRNPNNDFRRFANGTLPQSADPFAAYWSRDYEAISYCNRFLKDNIGYNTRYLVDHEADRLLRNMLQGDAFALRAWYQYDLLKKFGGRATNGQHLGFPIITQPADPANIDANSIYRNSYQECVERIIADCDSAYKYLPLCNRNSLSENTQIEGAIRYRAFDKVSVAGLKALVWLLWASPANNPQNETGRWEEAARSAAEVMRFKLDYDGGVLGKFNPYERFLWTDPNSPEIVFTSSTAQNTNIETQLYPNGFNGSANIGPTQELVDAFPMANGYPINHPKSLYDPKNPYANRDPRFYATVFHNGSQAKRISNSEIMYTFETYEGGKDAAGGVNNSITNYYVKKFVHMGWNASDASPEKARRGMFHIRWTTMCLTFAEAANQVGGPYDKTFGFSAVEAIAYLRGRMTNDNVAGVGYGSDPYLAECAASGKEAFDTFLRNERRIETCFEGQRIYDLRRWATGKGDVNKPVSRMKITKTGKDTYTYTPELIETLNFNSIYLPLPYAEVRKAKNLVQNEGWETWK